MNPRVMIRIAAAMFTLVGAVHLIRLVAGWPVTVGTWDAPLWISAVAAGVAFVLAVGCVAATRRIR